MGKTIKTREVVKDIKTLQRKPSAPKALKSIAAKGKAEADEQAAQPSGKQRHQSPNSYAEEKTEQGAKDAAVAAVRTTKNTAQKVFNKTRHELLKHSVQKTTARQTQKATTTVKQGAIRTKQATAKAMKQPAKGSIKGTARTVKIAKATSKTAVKTTRHVAQGAKAAAKTTQVAARNATHVARATAKAIAATAKAIAKAIAAFVKMAIAAAKSLVAAIAAGGWVAVVAIVIVCLVGLIVTSAFGIFFTGGDMGDGNPTLREVVADINQEHQDRIEQIKADNPHDDLMLSGTRAKWQEVLAIYAVKATTDTDNPLDAITLDEHRQQMLKDIFWGMNSIETRTEDREYTEIIAVEQADGAYAEEYETYTRRTLFITQVAKSAEDMTAEYGFTSKQKDLLDELLSPHNASTWQAVLYGFHSGAEDIVEMAVSQLGNVGGEPYWSWYGFGGRVEWCACFVSWCANETGYIESGRIPRFSYCPTGAEWFRDAGRWQERGYAPQPGDIFFFDWQQDGETDHVGIVESCDGSTVRTIEGNSSDAVRRNTYGINSSSIYGYGTIG
jgi:hypothetical protein